VFIRVYRLEIQACWYFRPSFVKCCLSPLLSGSTLLSPPSLCESRYIESSKILIIVFFFSLLCKRKEIWREKDFSSSLLFLPDDVKEVHLRSVVVRIRSPPPPVIYKIFFKNAPRMTFLVIFILFNPLY